MTQPFDFATTTSRFALPMLFQGQSQKEFYFNEAMSLVDALLCPVVEGEHTIPPSSFSDGEAWIVATGASGDWAGNEDSIAVAVAGTWNFIEPSASMVVFDKTADQIARFGNGWNRASEPTSPTGGSVIDQEARTTIDQIIEILRVSGTLPAD